MDKFSVNSTAFKMATELLHVVEYCLYRAEHQVAREEFFRVCKKGLEDMMEKNGVRERMNPSVN
jgi:hypothetical protein